MNLFVDYVQPLTEWLQQNPRWSIFITFIISLTESLAIIGSIIPGSVTMTAIGILAGSGIMRIDLTLLAAISGAVVGDSLSYALGYFYSEQLTEIWPFSKHPRWLQYGKEFFATHGGKSVLIGRFVGPLRSIIPVIAGIMHMKQWHFFGANLLSAIGWSLLYIIPGVIIGAASHELPAENATRLFILILILLAGIWLISLMIQWMIRVLSSFLKLHLHNFWLTLKTNFILVKIYNALTPKEEINHFPTASIVFIAFFCLLAFSTFLILTTSTQWLTFINLPTHLFFQSFNTATLRAFFIFCTQLTSTATLISVFTISCCWFVYHKKFAAAFYLLSLTIFSSILAYTLAYTIYIPKPTGILTIIPGSSFPAINLQIATALYGFILFYINHTYSLFTNILKTIVFTILGLSGLGAIYLSDYWLSDVLTAYCAGTVLSLIFGLLYRKSHLKHKKISHSILMIFPLLIAVLLSTSLSTYFNFQTLSYNHTPYHKEFSLSSETWWQQKQPILPIYQMSRVGKRISLLNIQFAGNLESLQNFLVAHGWKSHTDSFFTNLLMLINKQPNSVKLPLFTQLYESKAPMLIMTYSDMQSQLTFELRIWKSNYNLTDINKPLWIGSVHPSASALKQIKIPGNISRLLNPISYMFPTENPYVMRQIRLPNSMIKTTKYPTQPYITLIKSKSL
ncbi:MAG: VTT domain-containing protein [Legionella longbeachae]|nr:VTT domain-containing protein [Legionella longbeachae]